MSNYQSILRKASVALRSVVNLAIPLVCVHCDEEGALLCDNCMASTRRLGSEDGLCLKCADPASSRASSLCGECVTLPPPLDRMVSIYRYESVVRSAIHALKYRGVTALAPILVESMSVSRFFNRAKIDCVIPVPMHRSKVRERGYNQASLLGKGLSDSLNLRFLEHGLSKIRATQSQVRLSRYERLVSQRGVYRANYSFSGAHVLLVDDVATTGSTLMSCAASLKRSGARRVSAVTLAKELQYLNTGTPDGRLN